MKQTLTIGISSRDGDYYTELLSSLAKAVRTLKDWQIETILSVGGNSTAHLAEVGRAAAEPYPELCLRVIERAPDRVSKPDSMNEISQVAKGDLILYLDDDIKLSEAIIVNAIEEMERRPKLLLVGAQQVIIRPIGGGWWRNFIYDVINIQQIADVFTAPDPFIFGRFMLIRKAAMPVLPRQIINEDKFLQVLFSPNETKIADKYEFTGVDRLPNHYRRVFRLMDGRAQVKELVDPEQYKRYINKPENKRILDRAKIRKLRPYLAFCFLCYRVVRGSTHLLKPFLYSRPRQAGWKRKG